MWLTRFICIKCGEQQRRNEFSRLGSTSKNERSNEMNNKRNHLGEKYPNIRPTIKRVQLMTNEKKRRRTKPCQRRPAAATANSARDHLKPDRIN